MYSLSLVSHNYYPQLRFDTLRYVQDRMSGYRGKYKINTPNIDNLARSGVDFMNAYWCVCSVTFSTRDGLIILFLFLTILLRRLYLHLRTKRLSIVCTR